MTGVQTCALPIWGDFGGDPTTNNRWGNNAFSSGSGIAIPSDGTYKLLCYVVVENFNSTLTSGRTAQFKIPTDSMWLDQFGPSAQLKVRIDEKKNANALPIVGPVTVSNAHASSNGDYPTVRAAFNAINVQDQASKNILVTIHESTTETDIAQLNAGAWTSLTMFPDSSGLSVSGNLNSPLIDLSGATNVTIDGRVNATGSTKALTITNTNTGTSASTIRFVNDATNNKVQYCNIKGASANTASGVVFFSTTTGTTGNNLNVIANNDISSDAAGRPVNAVFSTGHTDYWNSGDTIRNNNIFDFFNLSIASNAILLAANNTNWTISGNSFYETTTLAPASVEYNVIRLENTGTNFLISGNYIGGSAPTCSGTFVKLATATATGNNTFNGIYLDVGSGTVKANTIKNINWANAGKANWTGIHVNNGEVTIGGADAADGNIIGDSVGTSSIVVTAGLSGGSVYGITDSSETVIIKHNSIGAITTVNSNAAYNYNFYGIQTINFAGLNTIIISDNLIGSKTKAQSIYASSPASGSFQEMIGIVADYDGSVSILNNTIANMKNASLRNTSRINGIKSLNGENTIQSNTIQSNTIHDISNDGGTGGATNSSVVGINFPFASSYNHITKNTIYNLECTNGSGSTNVIGIFYNSYSTGLVEKNFIHSLSTASSGATIVGITIHTTKSGNKFQNNLISLTAPASGAKIDGFNIGNPSNDSLIFNTVSITGTNNVTENACLRVTELLSVGKITNNIFANTCSGSSSHYSIFITDNYGSVNFNDYIGKDSIKTGNPSSLCVTTPPRFKNASGDSLVHYIPQADTLVGDTLLLGVITDDIDGHTRCLPTMGAQEDTTSATMPEFTLGPISSRCQGAGNVTYSAKAYHTRRITYRLDQTSSDAGNSIDQATGVVTYTPAWFGTTYIYASAFGCNGPKTATHTVTVSPKPATTPIYHN